MPEHSPKVSIVLPTYNGERYLRYAIQSCLKQTYQNWELIVIDDGSTDSTPEIVRQFSDERIKYFRQPSNQGHIKALNRGFSLTTGELLTWTSDDNYYAWDALEVMAKELLHDKEIDFVYANYYVVDYGDVVKRFGRVEPPKGLDQDNYVGGCFLYRRKVYEAVGDFNEEAFLAEDYEYWLRVRQKFSMKKIDRFLYFYRMHDTSLTAKYKEEKVQEQVERIRDNFISEWKKFYFHGRKYYYGGELQKAKEFLMKSFMQNPFYSPAWRLLVLISLDSSLIQMIRKIKHSFKN